jgi:hypothetical protein
MPAAREFPGTGLPGKGPKIAHLEDAPVRGSGHDAYGGKDNPPVLKTGGRRRVAVAMYARISTLEGSPELRRQDGFKVMAALADRRTGKTLGT